MVDQDKNFIYNQDDIILKYLTVEANYGHLNVNDNLTILHENLSLKKCEVSDGPKNFNFSEFYQYYDMQNAQCIFFNEKIDLYTSNGELDDIAEECPIIYKFIEKMK